MNVAELLTSGCARRHFMNYQVTKLIKHITGVLVCLWLAMPIRGATAETLRVYFIGNSVTDTVRYGELAKLTETQSQAT